MTLITGPATNSNLCSFVLTQFCPTHPLAHLIFSEGGQFWKFWFVGASRVKRPLTAPPTPFMRLTPSPLLCPKFLLKHLILSRKSLRKSFMPVSPLHFQLVSRKKDGGRSFHESPLAPEMVKTKWGKWWLVLTSAHCLHLPQHTTHPELLQPQAWSS